MSNTIRYAIIGEAGETKVLASTYLKNGSFELECEGAVSRAELRIQTNGAWTVVRAFGGAGRGTPKIMFQAGVGVTVRRLDD